MLFEGRNKVSSGFRLPDRPTHNGIDIVGMDDINIHAQLPGVVEFAGSVRKSAWDRHTWEWGNHVRIICDDGIKDIYAHMSAIYVRSGQRVEAGEIIGKMGNTGYSFGAHTHYESRIGRTPINPAARAGIENRKGIYKKEEKQEMIYNLFDIAIELSAGDVKALDRAAALEGGTVLEGGKTYVLPYPESNNFKQLLGKLELPYSSRKVDPLLEILKEVKKNG